MDTCSAVCIMQISKGTYKMKLPLPSSMRYALGVINRVVKDFILRRVDGRYIVDVDSAFVVTGFSQSDRCIYLRPNENFPLYGVSLDSGGNLPQTISYFDRLIETYGAHEDSRLFCFYTKSPFNLYGKLDSFCTEQNLYIYSHSKSLLLEIAQFYETQLLTPKELFASFLDVGFSGAYYNDSETLRMHSYAQVNDFPLDRMAYLFRALYAEGVYGATTTSPVSDKPITLYQGVGVNGFFSPGKPDIVRAMSIDWRGYLSFVLELNTNKVKWEIEQRKTYTSRYEVDKEVKEGHKMMLEEFEKNPYNYLLMNCVFATDNRGTLQDVSEAININFVEKKLFAKDILYRTPIRERDTAYDFVITIGDAKKFLSMVHRKDNLAVVRPAEMCGRDVTGNYTQFSFYESPVPHAAVIAKSRSGKTVFVLGMLAQAIRSKIVRDPYYIEDHRDVLENSPVVVEEALRLGVDVGVVQFDIGYSGLKWITQLKKCVPSQVYIYSDNLNKLRFGLTDVGTFVQSGKIFIDKTDGLFMVKTISSLLEISGQKPLDAHESQVLLDALAELFADQSYKGMTFGYLRELGGYEDLLKELESMLGKLDDYTATTDVELPEKYAFCQVPLLSDVIRVLKIRSKAQRVEAAERATFSSTALKLKPIAEDPFFGYYNRANIPSLDYFYMELESLKKLGDNLFIPIYLMVFQQQYRKDIAKAQQAKNRNKATIEKIYIMEEAHNLFKIPSLASFFGEVVREAARYGIVFVFITQNAEDIPKEVLLNLGNRILMPAPGVDRENQLAQLAYFWQTDDEDTKESKAINVDFFKRYSKRFSAVIKNANGVFTLEQYLTKEQIWLFNSDAVAKKLDEEE